MQRNDEFYEILEFFQKCFFKLKLESIHLTYML